MSKPVLIIVSILFGVSLFFCMWGATKFAPPLKTFSVGFYTRDSFEEIRTKAYSYELNGGCVKFDTGLAICHILGVGPVEQ